MNILHWLAFASIIWGGGYWLTRLSFRENLFNQEIFIQAPNLLYLLCGKPQGKNIPARVMCIRGVYFQLTSFFIVLYAVLYEPKIASTPFQIERFLLGWLGSLVLALVVSIIFIRFIPYRE